MAGSRFLKNYRTGLLLLLGIIVVNPTNCQTKKIIGFGWDYPNVSQLLTNIGNMQQTPFDGICFSLQPDIIEAFYPVLHPASYYMTADIKNIKWGKYTDNYVLVRGMARSGGNWFNNQAWKIISKNMEGLSQAIKAGDLKGILFDPEYYYPDQNNNPWTYSVTQYPSKSFKQVQDQVRERGKQFVKALQKHDCSFTILSIWLGSLVAHERRTMTVDKSRHALLVPFMEGILLAKGAKVTLVDGNESAYWFSMPSQFLESAAFNQTNTEALMLSTAGKKKAQEIPLAQPVYFDGLLAAHPSLERGYGYLAKWNWLQENLKFALATSSSNTVWFYYEQVKWWQGDVNDTLSKVIKNARENFTTTKVGGKSRKKDFIASKWDNVNSGIGTFYSTDARTPMQTGDAAFNYTWNKVNNILEVTFNGPLPESFAVYVDHEKVINLSKVARFNKLVLNKFENVPVALLAKYATATEACALKGY